MVISTRSYFLLTICCISFVSGSRQHKVKVYGKEGVPLTLQCKNNTAGRFQSVIWTTNAYSSYKYTAFSYNHLGEMKIHKNFRNRIRRVSGTSIQLLNSKLTDTGNWECDIIFTYRKGNEIKERKRVKTLANYDVIIVSPPTIKHVYPLSVSAPLTYKKEAICEAYSPNPFTLTWIKIHGNFTKDTVMDIQENFANNQYKKRNIITFNSLSVNDIGQYLCVAKNIAGQVSREVEVNVEAKPMMLVPKPRVHVNIGQRVELKCVAMGYPKVSFEWLFTHNYEQIQLLPTTKKGDFSVSRTRFQYYDGKERSTSVLMIENVTPKHWGTYRCQAENKIGYAEAKFTIEGHSIPDAPALLNTEDIGKHHITLLWLLDKANGQIKSIFIEKRQIGQKEWDRVEVHKAITKYTFSNLDEDTLFEFRLRATNVVGTSAYSEIQKLRTNKTPIVAKSSKKDTPKEESKIKNIIFGLDIIALTAIGGGILILITCVCAVGIIVVQRKKFRSQKKRKSTEKKTLIQMNRPVSRTSV
ncbi:cell adhesion molecule-related/down-regulated by oncogenes-like [Clytia hemisphaerica]|uniref:Uncharacterized protein n=1 Tax=Clytia hemisphaerica TaxID=252671 RepID=A0A7M5WSI0_9CNID